MFYLFVEAKVVHNKILALKKNTQLRILDAE